MSNNVAHAQWKFTAWGVMHNHVKRNVLLVVEQEEDNTSTLTCPQQALHSLHSFKSKTEEKATITTNPNLPYCNAFPLQTT